jgi:hypothetical protein
MLSKGSTPAGSPICPSAWQQAISNFVSLDLFKSEVIGSMIPCGFTLPKQVIASTANPICWPLA